MIQLNMWKWTDTSSKKKYNGLICIPYVPAREQLADILTKGIQNPSFKGILDKLGMKNLFHPA